MTTHVRTLRPIVLGLSVVLVSAVISCSSSRPTAFPCACDHLVYFQSTDTTIPAVTVHTTGNPLSSGDQVAWALITPGATISSITMPADSNCGNSTTGSWSPYRNVTNGTTTAASGPLTQPTSGNGPWDLYYRVNLTGGNGPGPCGHIIIIKP